MLWQSLERAAARMRFRVDRIDGKDFERENFGMAGTKMPDDEGAGSSLATLSVFASREGIGVMRAFWGI